MADTQRRRGEGHTAYRKRAGKASSAMNEAARQKRAGQMNAWRERYTSETGQSATGIANAAKFDSWLKKKRRDAVSKKTIAKPTMKEAGDALAAASPD